MPMNRWLLAGGVLDLAASLLHLGCIVGGPAWYRFFGAGEGMARLAERGSPTPALITVCIAAVLGAWAAYAFSGAGMIIRLPLLRPALLAITCVYLVRAAALPWMLAHMPGRSASFLIWSSVVVLILGVVHAVGLWLGWSALKTGF